MEKLYVGKEKTGKLMIQFGDKSPEQIAEIYDYGKFKLELENQNPSSNEINQCTSSITFLSKNGDEKFRLFLETI